MAEQSFKVDGGIEAVGIITASTFAKIGGSSTEFLKADGSVDVGTYKTTDTNTTYDIQARDSGVANKKHIRLSTVGGGNTDVTLVGGSNVTINRSDNELEIASSFTNTDTTYGVSAGDDGNNKSVILTAGGFGSGISSISFVPGDNVTLSRSGNNITIGSTYTDTDTTYSVGDGGLTENNFTNVLLDKLQNIAPNAEVNVQSDWNSSSGDSQILNKPTNISTWTNDSGYLTTLDDTLTSVTNRGNTTTNDVGIGNLTAGIGTFTGALTVTGNFTVNGTQTIINSNTLQVADSQIYLNRDETGTPSQNGGLVVERGTSPNVQIRWNEGNDKWEFTNDGSTFQNFPTTNTTYGVSAQDGDVATEKKVRLSGSNPSSTDEVVLAAGNNMSVARSGDKITFNSSYTDTDTTYSQSCVDSSNDVILRLTAGGTGSGNDDIKVKAGSNITLTHDNASEFTITGQQGVPSGFIGLWSGAANAIPSGWYLCNGQNGTPNLSGKFVVGYSNNDALFDVGDTGGSKDAVVVSHSHGDGTLSTDNDTHNHGISDPGHIHQVAYTNSHSGDGVIEESGTGLSGYEPTESSTTGISINNDTHAHDVTGSTSSTGESGANKNLPPYYALCYIMKS